MLCKVRSRAVRLCCFQGQIWREELAENLTRSQGLNAIGLHQDILSHPVSELELRYVITVHRDESVRHCIQQMRSYGLGCVVVVGEKNITEGKFTERLLIPLLLSGESLDEPVAKHMSTDWGTVSTEDPIANVIEQMESKKLRFVIVVNSKGQPVGLTGQKGVAEYIAEHFPRRVKVQESQATKIFLDHREGA